jgi:uncharacterized membrane protein YfcA
MMICSVYAQCAGLAYLRKSMNAGWALPFIGGGLAGVPIAVMVLAEIEAGALRAGFGAFLIAYSTWALLSLYGITQRFSVRRTVSASEIRAAHAAPSAPGPTVRDKVVVGLFAGLIGGLTAMPVLCFPSGQMLVSSRKPSSAHSSSPSSWRCSSPPWP